MVRPGLAFVLLWACLAAPGARAADYGGSAAGVAMRSLSEERVVVREVVRCRIGPPVLVNSLRDPTYVGSVYGLGRPSRMGLPPPLGVDPLERRFVGCR